MKKANNRKEIQPGTVFGEWTVLEQITSKDSKARYISLLRVRCGCGTEKLIRKSGVIEGRSKACKPCSTRLKAVNPGYKQLGGAQIWHIKKGAEKRNLEYKLTPEYMWTLLEQQDFKCALTGIPLIIHKIKSSEITASLDRIDNTKGYTPENVRWVHKRINVMRMNMTDQELLHWCTLLINHNKSLESK